MITLNLVLWILAVLGSAASAAFVLSLRALSRPGGGRWAVLTVLAVTCLLLGILYGVDARTLFEFSPAVFFLLQTLLPMAVLILGGYLATRWYTHRADQKAAAAGVPSGLTALAVAAGACALISSPGLNAWLTLGIVAVLMGALALAALRHGAAHRRAGLAIAVCLLWSGAFLVYLTVFPEQIAVGYEQPEDAATRNLAADLLIAAALVAAFILGFLKIRRG